MPRSRASKNAGGHMRARLLVTILAAALATVATAWAQSDSPPANRPPSQETPKAPAPPPSVTVIGARDAHGILGREVRSAANEDMGRIVDVIVDREGNVRAAVIDFGGFLGVGSRKIVVDWGVLRFGGVSNKRGTIPLVLTKAPGAAAPPY